MDLINLVNAVR